MSDDRFDDDTDDFDGNPPTFQGGRALVTSFLADDILTIDSSASLREAAARLDSAGVGIVVVGTPEAVEGVVSERDILRAVAEGVDLDTVTIAEFESTTLMWATPDSTVAEVAEEMMEEYVRHVLVGEDHRLIGIVSMRDILAAYLD